jgi:Zn-dependent protease with chaperone function
MKGNPPAVNVRRNLWRSLAFSFLMPALLLGFYAAAPSWLNSRLQGEVVGSIDKDSRLSAAQKTERTERFEHLDFGAVCLNCPPGMESLHDRLVQSGIAARFERLRWGLVLSTVLVALLVAAVCAVAALNARAGKSKASLMSSYQWGWRISIAAALAKVFFLIPLLTYGAFEFTVLLSDQYFPKLLIVIVVGGLIALWRSASILLKSIPLEFTERMCREITPEEAPELWQAVRAAAERLHTAPPDRILAGLQLNFYVTELAVIHDAGRTQGKTLFLSFPLLKQLSEDEIIAIIGHELGHFIGEDTKMTRDFYPLRLKAHGTLVAMASAGWIGWPSCQLLNFFSWRFSETEGTASRARELLADQKAAELTSSQTAAHALLRFQVAAEAFQRGLQDALKDKTLNLLDIPWQVIVREKLAPEAAFWSRLFEQKLPHPLDSHPTLQVRLEALGQTVTVEEARAIALEPAASAYEKWFANRPELFAGLASQASGAVEKMRARSAIVGADYQTEEGKKLLEEHFPEVKWLVKPSAVSLPLVLFGLFSLFFLAMAAIVDVLTARIILGGLGLAMAAGMIVFWKCRGRGELVLNAAGLSYSGWLRPLRFQDVQNITGVRQYSNLILNFHFKAKQPPLRRFSLVRFPVKRESLSLAGFDQKPAVIGDTIFKYFTRQPAGGTPRAPSE